MAAVAAAATATTATAATTSTTPVFRSLVSFQPSPIDQLFKAFQVLDPEGRGEIHAKEMRKHFAEQVIYSSCPSRRDF